MGESGRQTDRERGKSPESKRYRINVVREKEREQRNPRAEVIRYIKPSSHAVSNTKDYVEIREQIWF